MISHPLEVLQLPKVNWTFQKISGHNSLLPRESKKKKNLEPLALRLDRKKNAVAVCRVLYYSALAAVGEASGLELPELI